MKKSLLFLLVTLLGGTTLHAYDALIDGIYYNFSGNEATVTYQKYDGYALYNDYSGSVVIPASVTYSGKTYSVTSIGASAFQGCSRLTSVTIPESVTSIGASAFQGCSSYGIGYYSGLSSITIPKSVTSIGDYAFEGCSRLTSVHITDLAAWCNISFSRGYSNPLYYAHHLYLNGEEITNLIIPGEVTSIGDFAFRNCTSLTSIAIPNSVTSIGASAFSGCNNLTSVHITDLTAWCNISFSSIDSNPLYYAHHLYLNGEEITNLTIPEEVTSIGDFAFQYCTSLTSVTIPESVTTIGKYAFYGCSNLALINFPEGITSIGLNAFSGTAWYNNQPNGLLYIGNIVYKYFGTMPEGTQIEIKAGTVGIASQAFRGCSGLTSITIPGSVTSIGDEAFYWCTGLTSITIPEGVTSIGGSTFEGCSSLASITIPSTLTSVNRGAFSGCSSLAKVIVPDIAAWCGITYEGDNYTGDFPLGIALHLYSDENTEITEVVIPEGVTRIEARAFRDAKYVTSVTIPRSVTYIGPEAFRGMHRLTSINLPQGITSIERLTFHDCQALCSVSIPEGVTSILGSAFRGCQALRSVSIPEGVTSFSDLAFDGCSGLTSITIPKSAADIDASALSGCYFVADSLINLSDLTSERNWGATIYEGEETNDGLFIKWKDLWELWGCRPWVKSQTSITIPEGVMSIGDGVFSSYNLLINVTIPSSMTRIGRYAFQDCTGLTSITIPEGVTYIGPNAFRGCYFMKGSFVNNSELTSANYWGATIYDEEPDEGLLIKDNVVIKYRGTSSFVTIPDYVTSIGNSAFSRCSNLTSITIPNSVTSIGEYAFSYCI